MPARLPPLTALRAFEAAARHMSFSKAAAELHVTPAALSYQIKALEADLGMPVFRRLNRAVELTPAGRALAPGVTDAFAGLSSAWRNTQRLKDDGVLTVTAGPAFTSKWLAPRMFEFTQAHPEIDLRFLATLRLVDFGRDEVDVAIRFGEQDFEDLYVRPLVREWITPMASPSLTAQLKKISDLRSVTLVHDDSLAGFRQPADWQLWCRATGVDLDIGHGPRFSQADHALDAAMAGAGVVLGRVSLATRALQSGRLVAPFDFGIILRPQFRFVCPKGTETRPQVAAFESWVTGEISASETLSKGWTLIHADDVPTS